MLQETETTLYYLQSRYYDPAIGRFINIDAFVSTGLGIIGNNMYTYCLNNPVNMSDETGHYPVVWGMTCYEQAGWKIGTWLGTALKNWWNKATKDENNGITSNNVKAKKIMESVVKNIEFSAGIGQGIYAEFELLETSASVGMYGNYATINYQDGEWYTGQELHTGASLSATQFIEIGFAEDLFMQKGKTVSKSSWYLFNNTQESFTIISAGFYPLFIGGSIRIGFDVITFINDYDTIMGR